jgi:hypothetical protein
MDVVGYGDFAIPVALSLRHSVAGTVLVFIQCAGDVLWSRIRQARCIFWR